MINKLVYPTIFLLMICLVGENLAAQDYYIGAQGDTVYCEIIREGPYGLTVKTKKRQKLPASEIKAYRTLAAGTLRTRKYNMGKEDVYVLLPEGKQDAQFDYRDGHAYLTSDGTTTLYELVTYGGVSQYGRDIIIDLFVENNDGFFSVPTTGLIAGKKRKQEIIEVLKKVIGSNQSIMTKLNDEENVSLGLKAVKRLFEEYFNKKLTN